MGFEHTNEDEGLKPWRKHKLCVFIVRPVEEMNDGHEDSIRRVLVAVNGSSSV